MYGRDSIWLRKVCIEFFSKLLILNSNSTQLLHNIDIFIPHIPAITCSFECFIALYSKWQIIPSSSYWIGNHFIDVFIIVFSGSNFFQQVVVLFTIQKCNVLCKPQVLAYTPVVTAVDSVGKRSRSSQSILPYSPGYLCRETAILLCWDNLWSCSWNFELTTYYCGFINIRRHQFSWIKWKS